MERIRRLLLKLRWQERMNLTCRNCRPRATSPPRPVRDLICDSLALRLLPQGVPLAQLPQADGKACRQGLEAVVRGKHIVTDSA